MVNKKAWIQIVEAAISMMILFGLVLGMFQQGINKPDIAGQVYRVQHQILIEAQDDYCIRNEVLAGNASSLNKFIASRLCSLPYNFTVVLCNPIASCLFPSGVSKPSTDIYSDNLIIAANLTSYNPVKIAFFVWQGSTPCQSYSCVTPGQVQPFCGDHTCNGAETCSSCPADCGSCGCTAVTWYRDADSDGYGSPSVTTSACTQPAGYVADNTDCNDANAAVHPGALESCITNMDDNCNGVINEGCGG